MVSSSIPILFWLFTFSYTAQSQQLSLIRKVDTPPITAWSVDRRGDFYLAHESGTLIKYDSTGKKQLEYSPSQLGEISLIDAWNPLKTYLYYEEYQLLVVLDRFLNKVAEYNLSEIGQGFIRLACPSQDNNLWLIDESYNGLLKYDPAQEIILYRIPFRDKTATKKKVVFLREYQNLLFVLQGNGNILYFDNLGNYQGTIETAAQSPFSFRQNTLFLPAEMMVKSYDLYNGKTITLKVPEKYDGLLVVADRLITIQKMGGFTLYHY